MGQRRQAVLPRRAIQGRTARITITVNRELQIEPLFRQALAQPFRPFDQCDSVGEGIFDIQL